MHLLNDFSHLICMFFLVFCSKNMFFHVDTLIFTYHTRVYGLPARSGSPVRSKAIPAMSAAGRRNSLSCGKGQKKPRIWTEPFPGLYAYVLTVSQSISGLYYVGCIGCCSAVRLFAVLLSYPAEGTVL